MADKNQAAGGASERVISVDLNAADPDKAVTRRDSSDIARGVREGADTDAPRTKAEKDLFKRMNRLERNLQKQFDQQKANSEAEWQRERSDLQSKIDKLSLDRGGGDDAADAAHEVARKALSDKLAAAYEKGDSAASAEITLQISKLDGQYWANKAKAAGVVQRDTPAEGARPAAAAPTNKGPTVAGSRFIRANEDWWEDPDFIAENAACNAIYINLVTKEGFDPKSDETFKEVAKQLKAKFPALGVRAGRADPDDDDDRGNDDTRPNDAGDDERRPVRRQAPAARLEDRGDAGNVRRNTRTLTAKDIKTMQDCRLDPENDRDVVQFLKEAVALEAAS